jgi:DNA-binding beta-propeller fold protein YncE
VDQVNYDPASNRYFLPARHYVTNGTAAASGFSPQMGVIDGASRQLLFKIPVGTGAHSVAIDSMRGQVYVPFQPGAAGFPNGGISVFSTR